MIAYNLEELKFLIVDDNDNMRFLVKSILRSLGVKDCREAGDGLAALEEHNHVPADIVVCDWDMRPVTGMEFTRLVRGNAGSAGRFVPIIVLTGYTEFQKVVEARDSGAHEFLAKPVSAKNLYARVRSVIENPRPFIRANTFFGPDRRRKENPNYEGAERRISPPRQLN
jgi:DNA-binding response OmpR family regulator